MTLLTIEATWQNVMATEDLVLIQKLTVKCLHTVHAFRPMNRVSQILAAVLEVSILHIVRASPVNPATVLPVSKEHEEGGDGYKEEHDCVEILKQIDGAALAAEPRCFFFFMDRSSFVENGVGKDGRAVTSLNEVVAKGSFPAGTSAQQTKLRVMYQKQT
eukprot:g23300.t1